LLVDADKAYSCFLPLSLLPHRGERVLKRHGDEGFVRGELVMCSLGEGFAPIGELELDGNECTGTLEKQVRVATVYLDLVGHLPTQLRVVGCHGDPEVLLEVVEHGDASSFFG
jgi:hypothetical protein